MKQTLKAVSLPVLAAFLLILNTGCSDSDDPWDYIWWETNVYRGSVQISASDEGSTNVTARYTEPLTIKISQDDFGQRYLELDNRSHVGDMGTVLSLDGMSFELEAEVLWSETSKSFNRLTRTYYGAIDGDTITGVITGYNSIADNGPGSGPETGSFTAVWDPDYNDD